MLRGIRDLRRFTIAATDGILIAAQHASARLQFPDPGILRRSTAVHPGADGRPRCQ